MENKLQKIKRSNDVEQVKDKAVNNYKYFYYT